MREDARATKGRPAWKPGHETIDLFEESWTHRKKIRLTGQAAFGEIKSHGFGEGKTLFKEASRVALLAFLFLKSF
jgi:hypothetical protein